MNQRTDTINTDIVIKRATPGDAPVIAEMVGELLMEIMDVIDDQAFNFDLDDTTARLEDFIERGKYFVFIARDEHGNAVGFLAMYESHALYAEGAFGTLPELYVRPRHRCGHVGKKLLDQAKSFGLSRGWTRLEVTTPPLPQFDATLAFYEREGFTVSGGRKLKVAL